MEKTPKTTILIMALLTTFFISTTQAAISVDGLLREIQNMKLAIPQDKNELIDYLIKNSQPRAGIGIEISEQNNSVIEVFKEYPAEAAGIQTRDQIISVNGKTVNSAKEAAEQIRADNSVGRTITVKILRQGKELALILTTVLLRKDKTTEANKLAESIEKEFSPLMTTINAALDALASALKAGSINLDELEKNTLIQRTNALLREYGQWFAKKENEVDELLND